MLQPFTLLGGERVVLYSDAVKEIYARSESLLEAVKLAYRKHHLGDDSVGWDELSECLLRAICNTIGDEEYDKWIKNITGG